MGPPIFIIGGAVIMLNLKEQCPELLREIIGFPNDGKGTKLEDIYNETKFNQKVLRDVLGWQDGRTGMLVNTSLDLDIMFKNSKKVILSLLDEQDAKFVTENPDNLWENKLESGMKISKAIARVVSKNEHVTRLFTLITKELSDSDSWNSLRKELPKLPELDAIGLMKDPMVFVQNFMSEIALAKTKELGFTIDMFDFIRGCNSSNYVSCYTVSRRFNSAAPISFALSGKAGMIYNKDSSSIIGRCWVVFANDFKSFLIMKPYGFLQDESVHTVACNICALLNSEVPWYKVTDIGECLYVATTNSGIYGDPVRFGYSSVRKGEVVQLQKEIENPSSVCIMCGKRDASTRIICPSCENMLYRCEGCESFMYERPTNKFGFCEKCMKGITVCPDCGCQLKKGETCACQLKQSTCTFCDSEAVMTINGVGLCEDCAKILCSPDSECEVCGVRGPMYPYKKSPLCQRCYTCVASRGEEYTREFSRAQKEKINAIRRR